MAPTNRLRFNGLLTGTARPQLSVLLSDAGTTITFPAPLKSGSTAIPTIADPDYVALTLDPDTVNEEIVWLTAYTEGDLTATVLRGQEDTAPVAHPIASPFTHGPTVFDLDNAGGGAGGILVPASATIEALVTDWVPPAGAVLVLVEPISTLVNQPNRTDDTHYAIDALVEPTPPNGHYYSISESTGGTTGPDEPAWGVDDASGDFTLETGPGLPSAFPDGTWATGIAVTGDSGVNADGNIWVAGGAGTTGAVEPDWASVPAISGTIVDNDITWTRISYAATPFTPDTHFVRDPAAGLLFEPTVFAGHWYIAWPYLGGSSGSPGPAVWPTDGGTTDPDGDITWVDAGALAGHQAQIDSIAAPDEGTGRQLLLVNAVGGTDLHVNGNGVLLNLEPGETITLLYVDPNWVVTATTGAD